MQLGDKGYSDTQGMLGVKYSGKPYKPHVEMACGLILPTSKAFKASLLSAIADISAFIPYADKMCFQIDFILTKG